MSPFNIHRFVSQCVRSLELHNAASVALELLRFAA